jgi:hypothetical protein
MHTHTHNLPSGGDLRLAGENQKDSNTFIRSHRSNNVAHNECQHNKNKTCPTPVFQSEQRKKGCSNCSRKNVHSRNEPI